MFIRQPDEDDDRPIVDDLDFVSKHRPAPVVSEEALAEPEEEAEETEEAAA